MTARERQKHVYELARELGVKIRVVRSGRRSGLFYWHSSVVEVHIPRLQRVVWDSTSYLIALHELGHAEMGHEGMQRLGVEAEVWMIAIKNAREVDSDALSWALGPEALESYASGRDPESAPEVRELYSYASTRCPGWQR